MIRRGFCSTSNSWVRTFLESPREVYRLTPKFSPCDSEILKKANEVIDLSEKVHQMRLRRMQLLSLPASSVSGRNKELISLAIGAVSGALSLSFHPAFGLIFIVSYRMYRNASKPTRDRLEGMETAKSLHQEIFQTNEKIESLVSQLNHEVNSS